MKNMHDLLRIMLASPTPAHNRNIWRSRNGKTIKVSFLHGSSCRVKAVNTSVLSLIFVFQCACALLVVAIVNV